MDHDHNSNQLFWSFFNLYIPGVRQQYFCAMWLFIDQYFLLSALVCPLEAMFYAISRTWIHFTDIISAEHQNSTKHVLFAV